MICNLISVGSKLKIFVIEEEYTDKSINNIKAENQALKLKILSFQLLFLFFFFFCNANSLDLSKGSF